MPTIPPSLSPAEYRAVVEELIALSRAPDSVRPRQRQARQVVVLAAMELETMRTASAALAVMNTGFHETAVPLVRKVFEFGVVAQWLQVTGNSLEAFHSVSDATWRRLIEEGQKAVEVPQDLLDEAAAKIPPKYVTEGQVLKRFEQVCSTFGANSGLYLMYRAMSDACHPGMGAIQRWIKPAPEHPFGFVFTIPEETPDVTMLYTLAVGCLWMSRALDNNVHGRPRQAALKDLGRRIGVQSQLRRR